MTAYLARVGRWLYPVVQSGHHDRAKKLHVRVGAVGIVYLVSGVLALLYALYHVFLHSDLLSPSPVVDAPEVFGAGIILVTISVFAPQAMFRTGIAASTRKILDAPSTPIQSWRYSTIRFNSVLVGSMIAALYLTPAPTLLLFTLAFTLSFVIKSRFELRRDPNARYRNIQNAWSLMLVGALAYAIVRPLGPAVVDQNSIVPLVLASVVAMYVGIGLEALDRWVRLDQIKGKAVRDSLDVRRILAAVVNAALAFFVSWVSVQMADRILPGNLTLAAITGLGVFLASWLLLWVVSITVWHSEAMRTLRMWSSHQTLIATRLADGSLDPDLAAKAALPTTSRIAMSVFGAGRVLTIHDDGAGGVQRNQVFAGRDEASFADHQDPKYLSSGLRIPLFTSSKLPNGSAVTAWDLEVPGWFASRSATLVNKFSNIATESMVLPMLTNTSGALSSSFEAMFNEGINTPSVSAFSEALVHMRSTFDAAPHLSSLVVGVYAIDDFSSITVKRNERMAVTQVVREAVSNPAFANYDLFVAYEEPGRIWVALAGGPVIRTSVNLLRELQEQINMNRAIDVTRMDFDVLVRVSFGYAANQVDDLTNEGLMATALDRLAADQAVRNPTLDPALAMLDFTVESILEFEQTPVTAENLLEKLAGDDAHSHLLTEVAPVLDSRSDALMAMQLGVGWDREYRHFDLRNPENFMKAVNRQPNLAAKSAELSADLLTQAFVDADDEGLPPLPILMRMPSILLHPEAGELSLPNMLVPRLEYANIARSILVFDDIPNGAGQALRTLTDRGFSIAISTAAAAGANTADLEGWPRWAVLLAPHIMASGAGVDRLIIQQAASAVGTQGTLLIGYVNGNFDQESALANDVAAVIDTARTKASVASMLEGLQGTGGGRSTSMRLA